MSPSTKRTVFIAALLIVAAITTFGFIAYQVISQGHELTDQLAMLEEQRAQEASYLKLQRLAKDTTEDREKLQSFFLRQESDSIDFLNLVETISPEAGVALETNGLEVLKEKNSDEEWIQASFSFSGSRENVQNFVQVLETLPYVLRLTGLDMTARSTTIWQAKVTLQVRVLTYDK